MFVRQKEAKYSQISIYQFFGRQHENRHAIACSKILRKEAVFCKSYKNTLIRVFLHAEFISALKMEAQPTVFEKYAENRKKNICYHYFLFFVIFSNLEFQPINRFLKYQMKIMFVKSEKRIFSANPIKIPLRSQIQPNQISIYQFFGRQKEAMKIAITMLQPVRKFSEKRLFSANPIKIPLLGYFCMQNSFLH